MKLWMTAAGLLLCTSAQAHPIDGALDRCLDSAGTTVAMTACYRDASKAWDSEMNRAYSQLMKNLTGTPKEKLRNAQRQWLAYRDSWQSASADYFTQTQGTLAQISISAQGVALVRNQALMLQSLNKGSCASDKDC